MFDDLEKNLENAAHYYLDRNVESGGGRSIALVHEERSISYSELLADSCRAANTFTAAGIGYGNRVALIIPDSPLMVAAIFALLRIGAVPVPVSTRLAPRDYRQILDDCRPQGLILGQEALAFQEVLGRQFENCPNLWSDSSDNRLASGLLPLGQDLSGHPPHCAFAATSAEDMAIIQYTSGSTGRPKGVIHSHRALIEVSEGVARRFGFTAADVSFSVAKLTFGYGFGNSILLPFRVGASSIVCSPTMTPFRAFDVVSRMRPTVLSGVPSLYAAMLKVPHAEELDLSHLRLCLSAGERLSATIAERWWKIFGHEILDCFGMTECVHIFLSEQPGDTRPSSVGKVVPGYEAELVDRSGHPVLTGEVGELWVRGVCSGSRYWNRDDKTLEKKRGPWVLTADLFRCDEDGYYYFVGRQDDVIKVRGFKVSPIEVEECLLEHPAVRGCAVVAREDADGLAQIVAHICLEPGRRETGELKRTLKRHARRFLAAHKCPQIVEFEKELPRTPTGKIARHRLRRQLQNVR